MGRLFKCDILKKVNKENAGNEDENNDLIELVQLLVYQMMKILKL